MNKKLSEKEVDALVIVQADDDDAWEKPIYVNRRKIFSIVLPIKVDKDILSGEPVFEGTRVPVAALLDNLEIGVSLNEFLENFPTVKREQAVQVLRYFKSTLDEIKSAPTVAGISGRVTTQSGKGVARALIILTISGGETRFAMTNAFGYYRFSSVPTGATYNIAVSAKRFAFSPQTINLTDEIANLNFLANN